MEFLKGSFGSLNNFLTTIALPNCVEYLERYKTTSPDALGREQARRFFNAIVSIDSALDYLFNESPDPVLGDFKKRMRGEHPELFKLRDVANALKHCVRGKDKKSGEEKKTIFCVEKSKKHAKDLSPVTVSVRIDVRGTTHVAVATNFPPDAHETLEQAFRYWQRRSQQAGTP